MEHFPEIVDSFLADRVLNTSLVISAKQVDFISSQAITKVKKILLFFLLQVLSHK